MKTLSYIRVSTDKQEMSLEVQKEAIERYCLYKNITVDELVIDEDVSGGKPLKDRPNGKRLFDDGILNIVVYRLDRAFRNVIDALSCADYFNSKNITLHIVDLAGANINTATATGRLMFTMLASLAEYERSIIKERTKDGLKKRKDNGVRWSNNIPFGYRVKDGSGINHRTKNANQDVIVSDEEQKVIAAVKELINKGVPYSRIQAEVPNPRGGVLSKSLISRIKEGVVK